jgi:tetratricopeptide (TPR) repeat protein
VLDIEPASQAVTHTIGTVKIDGVRLRAVFDTGAATTILTRHAANRLGFKPDGAGVTAAGMSRGLGRGVVRTWIAPFDELDLGDNEAIKKIRLRVGEIDDASFDMLIGADFFLSHRVYVSNDLHKMFFSYIGGPVFDLSVHRDAPSAPADAPTTAEGFSGRGTAFAARHEYAAAKDDLTHAIALAPKDPTYRLQRARIELASGDKAAAAADIDAALDLAPADTEARLTRAELRRAEGDDKGAKADADAVNAAVAPQSDQRFALAMLYDSLGDTAQALTQYGLWIDAHHADSRLPLALNNRCWLRTLAGTDLKGAIDDCNRAVHMRPHVAGYLDSRGLARLRSGDAKKAIDDYDDALALDPKIATSLYGRGLAKRRLGDEAGAARDIAAAKAIDPKIADLFTDHGISR